MIRIPRAILALLLGGAAMLAACRGTGRTAADDTTASLKHEAGSLEGVSADTAAGTAASRSAASSATQNALEAEMRAMMGASGDQVRAMVPQHRQLVASMIAQMNSEMGSMNMGASAVWLATKDSVDRDLTRFPSMSARDIQAMMPAHQARISRLMQMHRGSMGGMMPKR